MTFPRHAVLALATLACFAALTPSASAADLGGLRGSIKDTHYAQPAPRVRSCYGRADVGYAFAGDPEIRWDQTDGDPASPTFGDFLGDNVALLNFDDGWFGEVGVGCGTGGSRGFRAEVMVGYHDERKIDGEPEFPWNPPSIPLDDPMHTDIESYSLMVNLYKDLGTYYGRFTPYVGAGIGLSYNVMDEVYFTDNPFLLNRIEGESDLSFAWAVMAGVGIQMTERATLDIGYRYLDLGNANSGRVDSAGFVNPRVKVDDITSHEIKFGLRYNFTEASCCETVDSIPIK